MRGFLRVVVDVYDDTLLYLRAFMMDSTFLVLEWHCTIAPRC